MTEAAIKCAEAMERAAQHAPFLAGAMARQPEVVAALSLGDLPGALALADAPIEGGVRRALRVARDRLALAGAIGDLAGLLSLDQVMALLSAFADRALEAAIGEAIRQRLPDASTAGFVAVALGKHGSRELNYSSDIDPILLYDPGALAVRPREDPAEAAARIARAVVDLLQTRDGDGYVLRVDLRLRPSAEVTPPALPIEAAISHYESSALAWERAAFVRARAAAGDIGLGEGFLAAIRPFVWRRSLDFGTVGALRGLSQQIRAHHASGQRFGPGFDLKRGRGGIREVEFFVQIQQLIHGGRNPALRVPDTLGAIIALQDAEVIDAPTADTLAVAYRLYRTIEHRLQMVDDRQTHTLPEGPALDTVAQLHGLADGATLLALLEPHISAVGTLYDGLEGPETAASADFSVFPDAEAAQRRIADWRGGNIRALRTAPALAAMERLLPRLVAALGAAPDPHAALLAFDRVLTGLPSALNLFTLLDARPQLLGVLISVLSHAPTLADALGSRPELLDRLIDASAFDPPGSVAALANAMQCDGRIEDCLDRVRFQVGEHRFALGTQIIEGLSDPIVVAQGYARVAEATLVVVADAVVADFARVHGRVPGSELVVLALGRLGGGGLTHASDLDLIYLFTGDWRCESDGTKPLGASHYYNRLAQRLTAGLSAPTSAGALYEVDTRLRPSGAQGPLVVSVESFARYQRESAWTWEHMALTRARPVFGSQAARAELAAIVEDVLKPPRDRHTLVTDIVSMRAEMAKHKPPLGPFDVKLGEGGLVDYEFAQQFAQLAGELAIGAPLPDLGEAERLLTRLLVTLRLVSPQMSAPPPMTRAIVARACGSESWDDLLERLHEARQSIAVAWQRVKSEAE